MRSKYKIRHLFNLPIRVVFKDRIINVKAEDGNPLYFQPSQNPILLLRYLSFKDPKDTKLFRKQVSTILKPGDSIIDAGAHIGTTVRCFHYVLGGNCRIWAFEPNPRSYALLKENTSALGSQVRCFRYALGNEDADTSFVNNLRHSAISKLPTSGFGDRANAGYWDEIEELIVTMRRLDTLLEGDLDFKPDFIKIDVEGAGGLVVKGAQQLLQKFKPICYAEYHSEDEKMTICNTLKSLGYRGIRFDSTQKPHWVDPASTPAFFGHPGHRIPSAI